MLRSLFIFALLTNCGTPPSESTSQSLSSEGVNQSESVDNIANSDQLTLVPYGYDGFERGYIYPSSIELKNSKYLIDVPDLKVKLLAIANRARRESAAVCFEGCALYTNLYLLPKVKDLYALDELKSFQRIKPCFKRDNGQLQCHSGPTSYTKKGSADFCADLVKRLLNKNVDILSADKKSIDADKVVSFLNG